MMKTDPQPVPLPILLVYGKPARSDLPQAGWFRTEERAVVLATAETLKLAVVEVKADADQTLFAGVYEGVLKGSGRMILGTVSAEVCSRLEAYAAATKTTPAQMPILREAKAGGEGVKEQNMNLTAKSLTNPAASAAVAAVTLPAGASPAPSNEGKDAWRALRVGAHVVAKFWETSGDPGGWWVAVVTDVNSEGFVARWLDEPLTPGFRIDAKHVALLHPSYDPTREWDRKR